MSHEMPPSEDVKKAEETMTDSQIELSALRAEVLEEYKKSDPNIEKRLTEISSIDYVRSHLTDDFYRTQELVGTIKGYEVRISKPSVADGKDYDGKKWSGSIMKVGEVGAKRRPMSPEEAAQVYNRYLWAAKFLEREEDSAQDLEREVEKELEYSPDTKDLLAD